MHLQNGSGKMGSLQFLLRISYNGQHFFGVSPQREGRSVQDAIFARLLRLDATLRPHAVSFAARTDRGVDAHENWMSFRLRLLPQGSSIATLDFCSFIIAALQRPMQIDDGIVEIRAALLDRRIMARDCVVLKHYRYIWPQRFVDGLRHQLERQQLQQAALVLSSGLHLGRLAKPRALLRLAQAPTATLSVQVQPCMKGGATAALKHWQMDVWGASFLRHQVRYMAACLMAVQSGRWRVADVAFVARGEEGPLREGLCGPADARQLVLMASAIKPALSPILAKAGLSHRRSNSSALAATAGD